MVSLADKIEVHTLPETDGGNNRSRPLVQVKPNAPEIVVPGNISKRSQRRLKKKKESTARSQQAVEERQRRSEDSLSSSDSNRTSQTQSEPPGSILNANTVMVKSKALNLKREEYQKERLTREAERNANAARLASITEGMAALDREIDSDLAIMDATIDEFATALHEAQEKNRLHWEKCDRAVLTLKLQFEEQRAQICTVQQEWKEFDHQISSKLANFKEEIDELAAVVSFIKHHRVENLRNHVRDASGKKTVDVDDKNGSSNMKVLKIQLHTDRSTDAVNLQIECGGKDKNHIEREFINKISKNAGVPKAQIPRCAGSQLVVPLEPLDHEGTSSEHSDLKAFLVPGHWLDGERSIIVEYYSNVWHLSLAAPSIEHGVNDHEVDRDLYERMSVRAFFSKINEGQTAQAEPDSENISNAEPDYESSDKKKRKREKTRMKMESLKQASGSSSLASARAEQAFTIVAEERKPTLEDAFLLLSLSKGSVPQPPQDLIAPVNDQISEPNSEIGEVVLGTALVNDSEPLQEDALPKQGYSESQEGSATEEMQDLAEIKSLESLKNELEELKITYSNLKKERDELESESMNQLDLLNQAYEGRRILQSTIQNKTTDMKKLTSQFNMERAKWKAEQSRLQSIIETLTRERQELEHKLQLTSKDRHEITSRIATDTLTIEGAIGAVSDEVTRDATDYTETQDPKWMNQIRRRRIIETTQERLAAMLGLVPIYLKKRHGNARFWREKLDQILRDQSLSGDDKRLQVARQLLENPSTSLNKDHLAAIQLLLSNDLAMEWMAHSTNTFRDAGNSAAHPDLSLRFWTQVINYMHSENEINEKEKESFTTLVMVNDILPEP
ncbi:hypothetical protein JR316_0012485 [Psilocybe cubensis]|uniref:Uncharacterized protein n=2 Tax=Psilocybe cubensis TaxID=181762 RepID=A0ACB8GIE2_PSICU|nr:hypothetical protein JR316_0012485 [Psilocybe cubensis]KAH9475374.1 hypothetical protein JR316_0012485 [Psilocybe cubensis]